MLTFFATCARGVEPLLAREIAVLGGADIRQVRAGVSFGGDVETAYRVCLWSRTASRVLMQIGRLPAVTADGLYAAVREIRWEDHLSPDGTLAVDFATDSNPAFRNTMFGAQRVKDAIVDRLRDLTGRRPSVDPAAPDLRVNVRVRSGKATLSLDLSGDALHRRGYREPGVQGEAPLKESLAAATLLYGDWPAVAASGGALLDPMCGSGTLLIEGAWIAGDVAPGLIRSRWGFERWLGHDAEAWDGLLAEADERAEAGLAVLPPIQGSDKDPAAAALAVANLARAGLKGKVVVEVSDAAYVSAPADASGGLLVTNPPYGERLSDKEAARETYRNLGQRMRAALPGWRYAVLAGDEDQAAALGMVPAETHALFNGAIPIRLDVGIVPSPERDATSGVSAFANRLRKDARHLGKWARREDVTCWRVYDADLPDYAVAVDVYDCEDGQRRVVVSEYEAPAGIDAVAARVRLEQALVTTAEVLDVPQTEVRLKVRKRQRGEAQYERIGTSGRFHTVREDGARLLVNLDDYLDTGLFLDHRPTRDMVARMSSGKSLLNLFCYTATATVRAAVADAARSVSVDLSNTYLDWARRNLALNGIDESRHTLVRADVLSWLEEQAGIGGSFDVVFCDPPSFSTSKAMAGTFDVQRDHVALLTRAASLLAPEGVLVFSTNLRRFRVDQDALSTAGVRVEDVSEATIPPDFARNPRIHRTFLLRRD
jgi:23S rRNA (guanine2445-N2)-methyltransferase / 23S rRNA (guanine2069-N7)-methyltransferase